MGIGEVAVGIVVVGLLLILWLSSAIQQIKQSNEKIKTEMISKGQTYNSDRAGKPVQDGCLLIVLSIVFAIGAVTLLGALVPLP